MKVVPVLPELVRYIESVCVLEGRARDVARPPGLDVPPSIAATLCITYGGRVERDGANAPSAVCGVFMRIRTYVPAPSIGVVMVTFRPGALKQFVQVPADALAELSVAAEDLFDRDLCRLEDQVASASCAATRARLVQQWLLARLKPIGRDPLAVRIAESIALAKGNVSVATIAEHAGLSDRQLARRFAAAVGIGPKRFARLARFSNALSLAHTGLSWGEVASVAGYSDQSHMNRDFVALVGASPESFARRFSVPMTGNAASDSSKP